MLGHTQRRSAVSCATMAEQIEMRFGLWTRWDQGSMCYVGCTLAPPGKYDWTVRVWWRWSLLSNYFDNSLNLVKVRVAKN